MSHRTRTAIDYFRNLLEEGRKDGDQNEEILQLGNLGHAYFTEKKYATAIEYYHLAAVQTRKAAAAEQNVACESRGNDDADLLDVLTRRFHKIQDTLRDHSKLLSQPLVEQLLSFISTAQDLKDELSELKKRDNENYVYVQQSLDNVKAFKEKAKAIEAHQAAQAHSLNQEWNKFQESRTKHVHEIVQKKKENQRKEDELHRKGDELQRKKDELIAMREVYLERAEKSKAQFLEVTTLTKEFHQARVNLELREEENKKDVAVFRARLRQNAMCSTCMKPATLLCTGCCSARYCSARCQKDDWKEHKQRCVKNPCIQCHAPIPACERGYSSSSSSPFQTCGTCFYKNDVMSSFVKEMIGPRLMVFKGADELFDLFQEWVTRKEREENESSNADGSPHYEGPAEDDAMTPCAGTVITLAELLSHVKKTAYGDIWTAPFTLLELEPGQGPDASETTTGGPS